MPSYRPLLKHFSTIKAQMAATARWLRSRGKTPYSQFDASWYLHTYPDVVWAGVDPLRHYLRYGWKEGRNPNPWFDTRWYLSAYPDVAHAGVEPLAHYLNYGQGEERNPAPKFISPDRNYFLKPGYTIQSELTPYSDPLSPDIIHQPHVYQFAAYLAKKFDCSHIIDIGCGRASKLVKLHPEFQIIGIDHPSIIVDCQREYPFGQWIGCDLDTLLILPLDPEIVKHAVIICADVIEHLQFPEYLLDNIHRLLNLAPVVLLSTPERDLVHGIQENGPPMNIHHIREWNLPELKTLLVSSGFNLEFIGLTTNNTSAQLKRTTLAVMANHYQPRCVIAPADFNVVAIMTTYNEADIIAPALRRLIGQGLKVYLIDNWSTDATMDIARQFLGKGLINIEQYPPGGRNGTYHWLPLLKRKEELARELGADWYIHHDVDEYRESPWPDVDLCDGLYHVDRCGFNVVDFTLINFEPIDNGFVDGTDYVQYFRYWEFGKRPGHFIQVKAWKNLHQGVNLTDTGGHHVQFDGQRIYPHKFLLRHYSFRTDIQSRKKIHQERVIHPSEEGKINNHYAQYEELQSFIRKPADLKTFNDNFYKEYLVERLSGINILP